MIKFGISWVARLLGVSGFTVQQPTTRGSLHDLNISERITPFNPSNLAVNNIHDFDDSEATRHLRRFQDTQTKLDQRGQVSDAHKDRKSTRLNSRYSLMYVTQSFSACEFF